MIPRKNFNTGQQPARFVTRCFDMLQFEYPYNGKHLQILIIDNTTIEIQENRNLLHSESWDGFKALISTINVRTIRG